MLWHLYVDNTIFFNVNLEVKYMTLIHAQLILLMWISEIITVI